MSFAHAGQGAANGLQPNSVYGVYLTGTRTAATLYTDDSMDTTSSPQVATNAAGAATFFAAPGSYDLVLLGAPLSGAARGTVTVVVAINPADATSGNSSPTVTSLGVGTGVDAPSESGTVASVPPTSATIQTALGNLALGAAFENTLDYDVWLTVYLAITVNTSLVVKDGVGATDTPTQETIITGTTALGIVPIRAKVPAGQFRLLSTSGTETSAIVGQYLEAA